MADLTITAANVVRKSGANTVDLVAGEAITAGEMYYNASDGSAYLADCTNASKHAAAGMALNNAATGQPFKGAPVGSVVDIGAILTAGETYLLSTAGKIMPVGDKITNDYVTYIGFRDSNGYLDMSLLKSTGIQVP